MLSKFQNQTKGLDCKYSQQYPIIISPNEFSNNMNRLSLFMLCCLAMAFSSCLSSANIVVSNGVDISKYKYVSFGKEQTGDRSLDDIMMLVQNEIANTRLQPISLSYAPDDYLGNTLTPNIHLTSEKWDGGHTYITITFYDLLTDQSVAVVKSSGIGFSIAQDQKLAIGAIRKKLQAVFGKKE